MCLRPRMKKVRERGALRSWSGKDIREELNYGTLGTAIKAADPTSVLLKKDHKSDANAAVRTIARTVSVRRRVASRLIGSLRVLSTCVPIDRLRDGILPEIIVFRGTCGLDPSQDTRHPLRQELSNRAIRELPTISEKFISVPNNICDHDLVILNTERCSQGMPKGILDHAARAGVPETRDDRFRSL